ncbi:DUF3426 domain-containing protein [Hydrogenophilus thermoluteolus]|uniref:DUF3426 domain-containing protein n=1 Tax=Hydrogenophilus thermoluteolus TaxID=297 RepID=UPI003F668C35
MLLALLLFLTALGQAAWVAHPTLIRIFPELYPIGETICQALGCTLTPPADSERIQIDDARLIKEADPARYTLELTMTNRADYPMPWPHLALTLTDGLGRALVRKNLLPADWGHRRRRRLPPTAASRSRFRYKSSKAGSSVSKSSRFTRNRP